MTTTTLPSLPSAPAEAPDVRGSELRTIDWLGSVVRVSDAPGGARIYGTDRNALHAVLRVDGSLAAVALIGDNNLSWVPVASLVKATPKELLDYQQIQWDRSAFVRRVPMPNNPDETRA